jgi:hypothetical protein
MRKVAESGNWNKSSDMLAREGGEFKNGTSATESAKEIAHYH